MSGLKMMQYINQAGLSSLEGSQCVHKVIFQPKEQMDTVTGASKRHLKIRLEIMFSAKVRYTIIGHPGTCKEISGKNVKMCAAVKQHIH